MKLHCLAAPHNGNFGGVPGKIRQTPRPANVQRGNVLLHGQILFISGT
jgi:hypothetical protein